MTLTDSEADLSRLRIDRSPRPSEKRRFGPALLVAVPLLAAALAGVLFLRGRVAGVEVKVARAEIRGGGAEGREHPDRPR